MPARAANVPRQALSDRLAALFAAAGCDGLLHACDLGGATELAVSLRATRLRGPGPTGAPAVPARPCERAVAPRRQREIDEAIGTAAALAVESLRAGG